jgi:hypothetical protein
VHRLLGRLELVRYRGGSVNSNDREKRRPAYTSNEGPSGSMITATHKLMATSPRSADTIQSNTPARPRSRSTVVLYPDLRRCPLHGPAPVSSTRTRAGPNLTATRPGPGAQPRRARWRRLRCLGAGTNTPRRCTILSDNSIERLPAGLLQDLGASHASSGRRSARNSCRRLSSPPGIRTHQRPYRALPPNAGK